MIYSNIPKFGGKVFFSCSDKNRKNRLKLERDRLKPELFELPIEGSALENEFMVTGGIQAGQPECCQRYLGTGRVVRVV